MQCFLFRKTLMPTAHWLERQIDRRREIAFPTVQPQNRGSTTSQTEFDSIRIFLRPQTPDWLSATLRCRRKPRQTRATKTSNKHRVASNGVDSDNFLENLQNLRPQNRPDAIGPLVGLLFNMAGIAGTYYIRGRLVRHGVGFAEGLENSTQDKSALRSVSSTLPHRFLCSMLGCRRKTSCYHGAFACKVGRSGSSRLELSLSATRIWPNERFPFPNLPIFAKPPARLHTDREAVEWTLLLDLSSSSA